MPKKLTKRQRAKLITPDTRAWVEGLDDETMLALHDLTHEVMDRRGEIETAALRAAVAAENARPVLANIDAPETVAVIPATAPGGGLTKEG